MKREGGGVYEVTKNKICLKVYCDIFLNGKIIIVKRFESSRFFILKGPGYFEGTTYHSSTLCPDTSNLVFYSITFRQLK